MSKRGLIADRIANFINENDLNRPLGGEITRGKGRGKPYIIVFMSPANLDGCITIYGEKFIRIEWESRFQSVPNKGSAVFESEENALNFLRLAFVEFDEAAMEIPTKKEK